MAPDDQTKEIIFCLIINNEVLTSPIHIAGIKDPLTRHDVDKFKANYDSEYSADHKSGPDQTADSELSLSYAD